jgi:hypothetical protein
MANGGAARRAIGTHQEAASADEPCPEIRSPCNFVIVRTILARAWFERTRAPHVLPSMPTGGLFHGGDVLAGPPPRLERSNRRNKFIQPGEVTVQRREPAVPAIGDRNRRHRGPLPRKLREMSDCGTIRGSFRRSRWAVYGT